MVLRSIGKWKRDTDVSDCEGCKLSFTFFRRRHHCRQCGGLFCSKCSEHALVITLIDKEKEQKVCDGCYNQKLAADRRLLQPSNNKPSPAATQHHHVKEAPPAPASVATTKSAAAKSADTYPTAAATSSSAAAAAPAAHNHPHSSATAAADATIERRTPSAEANLGEPKEHAQHSQPPLHHDHHHRHHHHKQEDLLPAPDSNPPQQEDGYRETVDDDDDEDRYYDDDDESDSDFDGPDIEKMMSEQAISSRLIACSSQNLSFLSQLQDSVRKWDHGNILNVLLFAGPDRQHPMVLTVMPHETMEEVAGRLTELYFRLEHPPFVRMTAEAAQTLRQSLHFTSEYQQIPLSARAMDVVRQSPNVVLSSLGPEQLRLVLQNNVVSGRSVREFLRSERSDNQQQDDHDQY